MLRSKPAAGSERERPRAHVLAREPPVCAAREPCRHDHRVAVAAHVFLHEDGIGARRHRRAGEDADCRTRRQRERGGPARGHALDHREPGLGFAIEIGVAHGVAVHCGIVERRQIDRREQVARNHAPVRRLERNGFDVGNRRNARADDALDLLHRKQRTRERETIVGQLRHQGIPACASTAAIGAACRIRMSTIRSTSSRSRTGTRACGNGASDATATIAGSSGWSSGLPSAAR